MVSLISKDSTDTQTRWIGILSCLLDSVTHCTVCEATYWPDKRKSSLAAPYVFHPKDITGAGQSEGRERVREKGNGVDGGVGS